MQKTGKGFSITALVLGIVAIVFAWFPFVSIGAMAAGIVGLVLAALGMKAAKAAGVPHGLGIAGLVLSIIGTALSVVGFFTCTLCGLCALGSTSLYL